VGRVAVVSRHGQVTPPKVATCLEQPKELKTHELPLRQEPTRWGTHLGGGGPGGWRRGSQPPVKGSSLQRETCPWLSGGGKSPLLLLQPGLLHRGTSYS